MAEVGGWGALPAWFPRTVVQPGLCRLGKGQDELMLLTCPCGARCQISEVPLLRGCSSFPKRQRNSRGTVTPPPLQRERILVSIAAVLRWSAKGGKGKEKKRKGKYPAIRSCNREGSRCSTSPVGRRSRWLWSGHCQCSPTRPNSAVSRGPRLTEEGFRWQFRTQTARNRDRGRQGGGS